MSVRGRTKPWTRQPQRVAQASEAAQSLNCVVASLMSAGGYDAISGSLPRSVGSDVSFSPTQYGLAQRGSVTGAGVAYGTGGFSTIVPVASEFTVMMLIRVASTGTRRIFLGDYNSSGLLASISIEQTATNIWSGEWVNTAPGTIRVSGGTVTTGWHWVEFQSSVSATTLWVDGVSIGTNTGTSTRLAGVDYRIGMPGATASVGFDGDIVAHFIFASVVNDVARKSIRDNPWQLFAPSQLWVPRSAASGVVGTLSKILVNDALSGSGTTTVLGSLSRTLVADTFLAGGTTTVVGSFVQTLEDSIIAASGAVGGISGSLTSSLLNNTISSSGTTTILGTVVSTLLPNTLSASGTSTITGTLTSTLMGDLMAATGYPGTPPLATAKLPLVGVGT